MASSPGTAWSSCSVSSVYGQWSMKFTHAWYQTLFVLTEIYNHVTYSVYLLTFVDKFLIDQFVEGTCSPIYVYDNSVYIAVSIITQIYTYHTLCLNYCLSLTGFWLTGSWRAPVPSVALTTPVVTSVMDAGNYWMPLSSRTPSVKCVKAFPRSSPQTTCS